LDLLKGFGNFLLKELKELVRDPKILLGMIVVPLIMFPALGAIINFSVQSAQEQAQKTRILVINNDGGNWSDYFINTIKIYANVSEENNKPLNDSSILSLLSNYSTTQLIEIPTGFSTNVTEYKAGNNVTTFVRFYGVFTGAGIFEVASSSVVDSVADIFNRHIAPNVLDTVEKSTIVKGDIKSGVDPAALSGLMISQTIALPITILILLTYSMQIAATSVAMEKEEKTLETLLTLPMDRLAILMGKLSSSIIVAAVGALTYMIGYNFMLGSFIGSVPAGTNLDLASLGLVPSTFGYLLLGISLFVALLSALALAVIMSAFAEDVRSAQSLIGYIYPFIFVPALALMYIDINTLPFAVRILIFAIPYSHPIIASRAVVMGDYLTPTIGIVYAATFTIVLLYIASRLFATEKILTAKLKFKGLRKRGKATIQES
jgi:ABC-2 type transport system permease protein